MKYAIIENEPLALRELQKNIEMLRPEWELVFTGETVEAAVDFFRANPEVDICFLDIELDDGNSFEIFKQVEVLTPVIFTTAYDTYVLEAFKTNSIDYLLKPFSFSNLAAAVQKLEKCRIRPVGTKRMLRKTVDRILISLGDRYSYVKCDEIYWLMSEDKYVFAVTRDGASHITSYVSLGNAEKDFDPMLFYRISRKYLVRIDAIKSVSKFFKGRLYCTLESGQLKENVIISAEKRDEFLQWYGYGNRE